MPKLVSVPELGQLSFPDEATNDQIEHSVNQALLEKQLASSRDEPTSAKVLNAVGDFGEATADMPATLLNTPSMIADAVSSKLGGPRFPNIAQRGTPILSLPEVSPQQVADAVDVLKGNLSGRSHQPTAAEEVASGLQRTSAQTLSGLTSPEMVTAGPAGASAKLAATFAAQMASGFPEQVGEAATKLGDINAPLGDKVKAVADPIVAAGMVGMIGAHASKSSETQVIPKRNPSPTTVEPPAGSTVSESIIPPEHQSIIESNLDAANGAKVRVLTPEEANDENAPFAGGGRWLAKPDFATGQVVLNPAEISHWLSGIPEEQRAQAVRSVLSEESIHLATPAEAALTYARNMTGVEKWAVRRRYGNGQDNLSPQNLGYEAIRFRMQQAMKMTPTEYVNAMRGDRSMAALKTLTMLESVVRGTRENLLKTRASQESLALLDKVQDNINTAKFAMGGGSPAAMSGEQANQTAKDLAKEAELYRKLGDEESAKEMEDMALWIQQKADQQNMRGGQFGPNAMSGELPEAKSNKEALQIVISQYKRLRSTQPNQDTAKKYGELFQYIKNQKQKLEGEMAGLSDDAHDDLVDHLNVLDYYERAAQENQDKSHFLPNAMSGELPMDGGSGKKKFVDRAALLAKLTGKAPKEGFVSNTNAGRPAAEKVDVFDAKQPVLWTKDGAPITAPTGAKPESVSTAELGLPQAPRTAEAIDNAAKEVVSAGMEKAADSYKPGGLAAGGETGMPTFEDFSRQMRQRNPELEHDQLLPAYSKALGTALRAASDDTLMALQKAEFGEPEKGSRTFLPSGVETTARETSAAIARMTPEQRDELRKQHLSFEEATILAKQEADRARLGMAVEKLDYSAEGLRRSAEESKKVAAMTIAARDTYLKDKEQRLSPNRKIANAPREVSAAAIKRQDDEFMRRIKRNRTNVISSLFKSGIKKAMQLDDGLLHRKSVTPDEIQQGGYSFVDPAGNLIGMPSYQALDPNGVGRETLEALTQRNRRSSRDDWRTTKKLAVIQNKTDGSVHVVSVFKHPRGENDIRFTDPRVPDSESGIPFGPPLFNRYRLLYSMLLDEPVRNFHQEFDDLHDYNAKFGDDAQRNMTTGEGRFVEKTAEEREAEETGFRTNSKFQRSHMPDPTDPRQSISVWTDPVSGEVLERDDNAHTVGEAMGYESPQDPNHPGFDSRTGTAIDYEHIEGLPTTRAESSSSFMGPHSDIVRDRADSGRSKYSRGTLTQSQAEALHEYLKSKEKHGVLEAIKQLRATLHPRKHGALSAVVKISKTIARDNPDASIEDILNRTAAKIELANTSAEKVSDFAKILGVERPKESISGPPAPPGKELLMPIDRRAPTDVREENLPPGQKMPDYKPAAIASPILPERAGGRYLSAEDAARILDETKQEIESQPQESSVQRASTAKPSGKEPVTYPKSVMEIRGGHRYLVSSSLAERAATVKNGPLKQGGLDLPRAMSGESPLSKIDSRIKEQEDRLLEALTRPINVGDKVRDKITHESGAVKAKVGGKVILPGRKLLGEPDSSHYENRLEHADVGEIKNQIKFLQEERQKEVNRANRDWPAAMSGEAKDIIESGHARIANGLAGFFSSKQNKENIPKLKDAADTVANNAGMAAERSVLAEQVNQFAVLQRAIGKLASGNPKEAYDTIVNYLKLKKENLRIREAAMAVIHAGGFKNIYKYSPEALERMAKLRAENPDFQLANLLMKGDLMGAKNELMRRIQEGVDVDERGNSKWQAVLDKINTIPEKLKAEHDEAAAESEDSMGRLAAKANKFGEGDLPVAEREQTGGVLHREAYGNELKNHLLMAGKQLFEQSMRNVERQLINEGHLTHKDVVRAFQPQNRTRLDGFLKQLVDAQRDALAKIARGDAGDSVVQKARLKEIERLRAGVEFAKAHWGDDAMNRVAARAKKEFDEQFDHEKENGVQVKYDEDFIPGRYDAEFFNNDAVQFRGIRMLGRNFAAPKAFQNHYDAIEAGPYIALTHDIASLVGHRVRAGAKRIEGKLFIDALKSMHDEEQAAPVAVKTKTSPGSNRPIPDPPKGVSRAMYEVNSVNPDIAVLRGGYSRMVNRMLKPSAFDDSGALSAMIQAHAFLKHTTLVADFFHLARIGYYSLANARGNPAKMNWRKGLSVLDYRAEDLDRAAASGMLDPRTVAWAKEKIPVKLGGNKGMMSRHEVNQMLQKQGYNVGQISDTIYKDVVHQLPRLLGVIPGVSGDAVAQFSKSTLGRYNKFLFDEWQRGLMGSRGLEEFERLQKLDPEKDSNVIARNVAKDLNKLYGNIGSQGWIQSKTMRDISRLLLLAPQWAEGIVKKDASLHRLITSPKTVFTGRESLTGTIGVGFAMMFALTQAMNIIQNGRPTWKNEDENHRWDWQQSKNLYVSPLSIYNEMLHDLVRYNETKPKFWDAISQIGENKLGFFSRAGIVLGTGNTPQGERITSTSGVLLEAAKQLIPMPITVGKPVRAIGNAIAPNWVSPNAEGDVLKQFDATGGIKAEYARKPVKMMADSAKDFVKKNGLATTPDNFVPTDEPSYSKLRQALDLGDAAQAKRMLAELRKTHTDQQILKAMTIWAKKGFTGSKQNERLWLHSLSDDELKTYEAAINQKYDLLQKWEQFYQNQ